MIYARNKVTGEHAIPEQDGLGVAIHYIGAETYGDWELVQADADGWIEWHVGDCPLPGGCAFEILDKDSDSFKGNTPEGHDWQHWCSGFDITHYRPILNHPDQPKKWRGPEDEHNLYEKAKAEHDNPSWDGEGLPPVGSRCKHIHEPKPIWVVAHHWDGMQAIWSHSPQGGQLFYGTVHDFMPIKTDRERWIEAAHDALKSKGLWQSSIADIEAIYDAGLARLPEE